MKVASRRRLILAAGLAAIIVAAATGAQAPDGKPNGKLVLYTSQPERDASQTVAAFKRVYPAVEVEVFRSGTSEVMAKRAAEFSG